MSLITIKLINLKQASDSSDEKFCPSLCIIYLEMITITWSLIRYIIKRCYTGFISDFHCVFTLTLCLINVPFNQQSLVLNISVSTQYLFTAFCIHLPFTLLTFWSYIFDIESHDRTLQVVALAAVLQLFGAESLQCSTEQKRLTRVTKESNRKKKKTLLLRRSRPNLCCETKQLKVSKLTDHNSHPHNNSRTHGILKRGSVARATTCQTLRVRCI